jgi:integral membrane sensor domain MASE1
MNSSCASRVANFLGIVCGALVIGGVVTAFVAGVDLLFLTKRRDYQTIWEMWSFGYATAVLVREAL